MTETTILGRLHLESDREGRLEIAHYTPRTLITRDDGSVACFTDQPLLVLDANNAQAFWQAYKALGAELKQEIARLAERAEKAAEVAREEADAREAALDATNAILAEKE